MKLRFKTAVRIILGALFALAVLTLATMCLLGLGRNADGTFDAAMAWIFGVAGTVVIVVGGCMEDFVIEGK